MAFWDRWLKPKCAKCTTPIVEGIPMDFEGLTLCPTCHADALETRARKAAELQARQEAEEAARRAFEDRKQFGHDPRYSTD